MRVRLLNWFFAEVSCLDTAAIDDKAGFDAEFGETRVHLDADGVRVTSREERTAVRVRCQIEDDTWRSLRMLDSGNSPESKIAIVCDMLDLRRAGLVTTDGAVRVGVNDRLAGIYRKTGEIVQRIPDPPGLYCIESRPISYGLGGRLNLCLLRFADRTRGRAAGG